MKIEEIAKLLPSELKESLSEDSLKVIAEAFERSVDTKVNERINLAVKSAEDNFNTEAEKKLVGLVNKIEEAHKIGLKKVVQSLKEKYQRQIKCVRNYYNKQVVNESAKFKNSLVESVDAFMNKAIKEYMPIKELKEAVRNNSAMKVLEGFKHILSVDESSVNKALRKPVLEGYKMIKKAKSRNLTLAKKNNELLEENTKLKTAALLESKLNGLPEDAKNHLRRVLKDADAKFINENFDYSLKLYKQRQLNERTQLRDKTMNNRPKQNATPLSTLVESKKQKEVPTDQVDRLIAALDADDDF